jgi:hypothetical protein
MKRHLNHLLVILLLMAFAVPATALYKFNPHTNKLDYYELGVDNVGQSHDHTGGNGAAIPAGGIGTNAVITAKILDNNVTPAKLYSTAGTAGSTTAYFGNGTWIAPVRGPASVTDSYFAYFDGTTGKLLKEGQSSVNPAFSTINVYGANALNLGTSGSYDGSLKFKSATPANSYIFTILGSNFGADIGWTLPTAAPAGNGYLLTSSTAGVLSYTNPATLGITGVTDHGGLFLTSTTVGIREDCGTDNTVKWDGSAWVCTSFPAGGSVAWGDITGRPTLNSLTISAGVLDNASNYPTFNQSTTGTAAGLTAQYVDWSASSGGTSVKNRPTINSIAVTGSVLDNALNYPTFNQSTTGNATTATTATNIAVGSDAQGDILVRGASAYGRLAAVAAGQPLLSGGASTAPAYAGYTFSGTTAQTYTFPATSKSLAPTDQTFYVGTTSMAINRASASQTIAGLELTAPNLTGTITTGSGATTATFNMQDSDVAHGVTTLAPTSTFGRLSEMSGTKGGLHVTGFSSATDQEALELRGVMPTTPDDGKSAIKLDGYAASGTGVTALGTTKTLLTVTNNDAARITVLANGNTTFVGTVSGVSASAADNSTKFATTLYVDRADDLKANANRKQAFGFGWDNAATTDNNVVFADVPAAMTITKVLCIASADNVVGFLSECTPSDHGSCTRVDDSNWTFTNAATPVSYNSGFENPTIAAGASLKWFTVSAGTANNKFSCTVQYNE